jgi:phosphoribosylformylglycinamidine synthase
LAEGKWPSIARASWACAGPAQDNAEAATEATPLRPHEIAAVTERLQGMGVVVVEGRYFADQQTLDQLESNSQVIYRYVSSDGTQTDEGNPNGAINNIAGICNKNRNVFGMMPHPERACSSLLNNTDGVQVFRELGLVH